MKRTSAFASRMAAERPSALDEAAALVLRAGRRRPRPQLVRHPARSDDRARCATGESQDATPRPRPGEIVNYVADSGSSDVTF
jgi:hypothetical protein